jgi:phosphoglycolate phosphatase
VRKHIGFPIEKLVTLVGEEMNLELDAKLIAAEFLKQADWHMVEGTRPIANAPSLLLAMKHAGFKLAIVTGKFRDRVTRTLRAHDMQHLFETMVCGDEMEAKPNSAGLERVVSYFNGQGLKAPVYIGDHYIDILTARNAGIECISVASGKVSLDTLQTYQPNLLIKSLDMLLLDDGACAPPPDDRTVSATERKS